jgi:hypothetical protein
VVSIERLSLTRFSSCESCGWKERDVADLDIVDMKPGEKPSAELTRIRIAIVMAALMALSVIAASIGPAHASTPPPTHWIIQNDELANLNAAGWQGTAAWIGCDNGQQEYPCSTGQTRTFTNYFTMRTAFRDREITKGMYAIMDLEGWHLSPRYQSKSETYWMMESALLANH